MDVDGLKAEVLNPDLKLENTEQQGRHRGAENLSLSLSPFCPAVNALRLLIDFRVGMQI